MGKNKRKRANHAAFHAAKARMNGEAAPVETVTAAKEETTTTEPASGAATITDHALTTTLTTLKKIVTDPSLFHSKRFKDLRRTLHPLVLEQLKSYDKGIDYRLKATNALNHAHWSDALAALQACRDFNQVPKQGTVQRWVRDCMGAENCQMQLLQAILKVSASAESAGDGNKHDPSQAWADQLSSNAEAKDDITILPGWKWWENNDNSDEKVEEKVEEKEEEKVEKVEEKAERKTRSATKKQKKEKRTPKKAEKPKEDDKIKLDSRVLYREAAAERTPPNHYDLLLHTTQPGAIQWDTDAPTTTAAHPIPFLPQPARVIANVFSSAECQQLRRAMTTLGYRPDHPVSLDKPTGIDSCEWMVDDEIAAKLYERVQPHLPETLTPKGREVLLHSLNSRWRAFRYDEDCVYRPHMDGSWPQSFVTPEGTYACPKQSAVKSYLTFLIYLNDDFDGGETRFYLPQGIARGVVPKMGSVCVFPQGNLASLIHEGSQVTKGVKYVVRTDVLYRPFIAGGDPDEEGEEGGDGEEKDETME